MPELILRKLALTDEAAFRKAIGEWDWDSGFLFVRDYKPEMPFSHYVDLFEANERGENLPDGYVPDTSLFAFVGGEMVVVRAV